MINLPAATGLLSRIQLKPNSVVLVCFFVLLALVAPEAKGQTIQLVEPIPTNPQGVIKLAFKINGASKRRIRVRMINPVEAVSSEELELPEKDEQELVINLWKEDNEISITGFVNDEPKKLGILCTPAVTAAMGGACPGTITIKCTGRWCKDRYSLDSETLVADWGQPKPKTSRAEPEEPPVAKPKPAAAQAGRAPAKDAEENKAVAQATPPEEEQPRRLISITSPKGDPIHYQDAGEVPLEIRVAQRPDKTQNIKNLAITVLNADSGLVDQEQSTLPLDYPDKSSQPAVAEPKVRVKKGNNEVTIFDPKNRTTQTVSINIVCDGPNCGEVGFADNSVDRFSSIYTRGIIGFEQSGGSAAESVQKPFLEFFWNPPISTSEGQKEPFRYIYPKASLWGSVKLTSVPQQVSTPLATFAPGFLSPINEGKVNELVQGFDFLVGTEIGFGKGLSRGDIGTAFLPTGVPDTKQKYSAYFITGFGAISPLSPRDSVQIFLRPSDDVLKKLNLAGLDPKYQFLAFTSQDRDSFFRQYYAGIRIKSHYFRQNANGKYEVVNRPGGMFDITFGQNEAVTGGRLIGSVLRFDGFYPLPVSNRSILYLYGTAMIKFKRKANVTDPVFLATAPSNTAFPAENVFVAPSEPSNRDLYRIGIGVNFLELLRGGFNKKP